ncbi:MAG TPA: DUF5995 family protein [Kofleriaceae bacterium]|nr:DUF5995 family protein [Kofleriaceae bacterium]
MQVRVGRASGERGDRKGSDERGAVSASIGKRTLVEPAGGLAAGQAVGHQPLDFSQPQRRLPRLQLRDVPHDDGAVARGLEAAPVQRKATGESAPAGTAPADLARGVQLKSGNDQPGDAYERHADAVADAVVAGRSAAPLLDHIADGPIAGGSSGQPAVQRKSANQTTTPPGLPDPVPAASIPPPASEPHIDAEGNEIIQDSGHWHLLGPPKSLRFPIAAGYKYQLLPINPNASYAALHARLLAIAAEQLAYANSLKGDMKYWFAKVYYFVTTHEIEAIDAGVYLYPHMKMQEVALFHAAYKVNLDAWQAGNKDKVEAHWKKAFEAADSEQGGTWYKPRSMELMHALLPSMQAHIRFDLPRALATCFVLHYAGIPGTGMSDFKADFDTMGPVFDKAQESLLSEIKDETWRSDPGRYGPVQNSGFPFIFSVPLERQHTFEKASRLAGGMQAGTTNRQYTDGMRRQAKGAHPFASDNDFAVDGTDVGDQFNWMNQPGAVPERAAPAPGYQPALPPPSFPEMLFFKQGRGQGDDRLEQAICDDQNLLPLKALAAWTRKVRDAEIYIEGHASAEGETVDNATLASMRAFLVKSFLWHCGADNKHNRVVDVGKGEVGATARPEWRYVAVKIVKPGTSRQQYNVPNPNLPSEAVP